MGGATALAAGDSDARIKAVLAHDPWAHVIKQKIPEFNKVLNIPL